MLIKLSFYPNDRKIESNFFYFHRIYLLGTNLSFINTSRHSRWKQITYNIFNTISKTAHLISFSILKSTPVEYHCAIQYFVNLWLAETKNHKKQSIFRLNKLKRSQREKKYDLFHLWSHLITQPFSCCVLYLHKFKALFFVLIFFNWQLIFHSWYGINL